MNAVCGSFLPVGTSAQGLARNRQTTGPREGKVSDLDQRIEAMHKRDVLIAWAFVVGLWFAIIFVAIATWDLAPEGAARTILLCAGAYQLQ